MSGEKKLARRWRRRVSARDSRALSSHFGGGAGAGLSVVQRGGDHERASWSMCGLALIRRSEEMPEEFRLCACAAGEMSTVRGIDEGWHARSLADPSLLHPVLRALASVAWVHALVLVWSVHSMFVRLLSGRARALAGSLAVDFHREHHDLTRRPAHSPARPSGVSNRRTPAVSDR